MVIVDSSVGFLPLLLLTFLGRTYEETKSENQSKRKEKGNFRCVVLGNRFV